MSPDKKADIRYSAGIANGIQVAVVEFIGRPNEFQVELLGTFEGVSHIGQPFIGSSGKADAAVFAESVFAALECAELTWLSGD